MPSFKFLIILGIFINLPIIFAADPNCESVDCKRCVEFIVENDLEDDRETIRQICIKNTYKTIQYSDSEQLSVSEVKLRVYNLTDKLVEVFSNDTDSDTEEGIYKSIVVFNKEFSLLPSMGVISENDPAKSPLGKPIQEVVLGTTSLTEQKFFKYLNEFNLENLKDEDFDEHLDKITNHLLSN